MSTGGEADRGFGASAKMSRRATAARRLRLAAEGQLEELGIEQRRRLLWRRNEAGADLRRAVAKIIDKVRRQGDAALVDMARRFDGARLERLEVPRERWRQALAGIDDELRATLRQAAAAIADFHQRQLPTPTEWSPRDGLRLGRRPEPLRCIGAYAPGGQAAYPSSLLMCVVPAKVAGVAEVIVCSPPREDGRPAELALAACELAGADRLFAVGGAGAVAAMALGTESVPRVDKVVGPGNSYVTEAKRQLAGTVAIDCLAGPSELLVVADECADAELVAVEMIAQAEHDRQAPAVLVSTDQKLARAVASLLPASIERQPRGAVIEAALAARGGLLTATDLQAALAFARDFAPEHLLLLVREPRRALQQVRCAGTVFLGDGSSVVFGDYLSGANHVLPTGGRARVSSGLSSSDFLRWSSYQEIQPRTAAQLAAPAARLAEAEGFPAHALAARQRAARPPRGAETAATGAQSRNSDGSGRLAHPAPLSPRRPSYSQIELYDPGEDPRLLNLADNTNLFGAPPVATRALRRLRSEALSSYPAVYSEPLKRVLAKHLGVSTDNIATGCGADDIIDSAVRAFCEPGERLVHIEPTFSMLPTFAHMNGVTPVAVPLAADFRLPAEELRAAAGRLIYICRPNNPTGTLFEKAPIEQLARHADALLLIDEAYVEFSGASLVAWASASGRVVIVRTLSKAYGLAGLRVGYAVGPAGLILELEKSRGPYRLSAAAEAAAMAAVERGTDWVDGVVTRVRRNRSRLAARLESLGLRCWPSATNFLLFPAPGGDAAGFCAALRKRGIGVRAFPSLPQTGDCIRVTIGPWALMERFLEATRELLAASLATGH
ncbi:MAG: histidinol dehydrogenase [Acidobacteriota bacterium]